MPSNHRQHLLLPAPVHQASCQTAILLLWSRVGHVGAFRPISSVSSMLTSWKPVSLKVRAAFLPVAALQLPSGFFQSRNQADFPAVVNLACDVRFKI